MHSDRLTDRKRVARAGRPLWVRVRVETDEGAYMGRVRLDGSRGTIRELIDDERAYLAVWDATEEPAGTRDDFVAIHKGAIRYVVVLGRNAEPGAQMEA